MELSPTHELLDRFADAMERRGIELVPADLLADLVRLARTAGASPVVVGVLVDPTEPPVARERAFAKVAARIIGRRDIESTDVGSRTRERALQAT